MPYSYVNSGIRNDAIVLPLAAGADPNTSKLFGQHSGITALHAAAARGNTDAVKVRHGCLARAHFFKASMSYPSGFNLKVTAKWCNFISLSPSLQTNVV